MSLDLFITAVASDNEHQRLVYTFLDDDRPLFEDDLPEKDRAMFLKLEPVPSYDWAQKLDDGVLDFHWSIRGDDFDEVNRTLMDMHNIGLTQIYASFLMEGSFCGAMKVNTSGKIEQLSISESIRENSSLDEGAGEYILAVLKSLRAKQTVRACS
ncbi:MAG: hypothetical protein HRU20_22025 [Pseudomonadales bacterium]|nr:hypothetical protein [Pseudomonadales bacterium]